MSQHVTRRRAMNLVLGTWAGMVLGGCGQKGPLYFPPEEKKGEGEEQDEGDDTRRPDLPGRDARREGRPARAESSPGESM